MSRKQHRQKQTAITDQRKKEGEPFPLPIVLPSLVEETIRLVPETNLGPGTIPQEIFMLHTLTGFTPKRDTISVTHEYMDRYEPQRAAWEKTLHPVTRALIALTQADFERKGLLMSQRANRPGQRMLDMLLLPETEKGQRGHVIQDLDVSQTSLVDPMREYIQTHAIAIGLNAINRACHALEKAPKGKRASILFFTSVKENMQDSMMSDFLSGNALKTLQQIYMVAHTFQETKKYGDSIDRAIVSKIALEGSEQFDKNVMWPASAFAGQDIDVLIKTWQGMDTRAQTHDYMNLQYQIQQFDSDEKEDKTPRFNFVIIVGPRRA